MENFLLQRKTNLWKSYKPFDSVNINRHTNIQKINYEKNINFSNAYRICLMNKLFLTILFIIILVEGCMSPLPKFKCIYDIYGDSTKYYIITPNEDYLKTVQYRHIIFSKYDSIENKWQSPIDSICEKEDSVLLSKKSQDSLFFFIEKGIRKGKNRYSYISTNTSKISLNWKGNIYKLQYDNLEQRSIISFLKKHSSIPIR